MNRIRVTGFVEDEDLPLLYSNADWFVFPSKYEGFGIPPLEAMGMGCPVLSSDAASLSKVLGDAAVYFKNDSVDSATEKLSLCMQMTDEERRLRVHAGKNRAALYSWEDSAKKLEQLLSGLVKAYE